MISNDLWSEYSIIILSLLDLRIGGKKYHIRILQPYVKKIVLKTLKIALYASIKSLPKKMEKECLYCKGVYLTRPIWYSSSG